MSTHKSSKSISGKKRKLEETNDEIKEDLPPSKYLRAATLDSNIGTKCPYLDQINRKALDFDFEKVCSVTMINHNVYGCLVCGSYFAGRNKNSPAYFHSLQENHKIFIHLDNGKIYCLPDDYQVIDPSLNDIKHNLYPTFTANEIYNLDNLTEYSHALNDCDYLPGIIGLNNLNNTDWLNVVLQSLMRVKPLRNYFINPHNYTNKNTMNKLLVTRFGELVRKYFNSRNFKGQVSPHELLQAISLESHKKFQIGKKSDPLAYLAFFLNQLHRDLGGNKKHNSSIISRTFQGLVTVTTYTPRKAWKKNKNNDPNLAPIANYDITTENKSFFYLLFDLPTMPLFKDSEETKFIPQIPLPQLLNKFNNTIYEELPDGSKKKYKFVRLPPYLLIAYRRFHENNFLVEKNSTIVGFVLKGLDLKEYLFPSECEREELKEWKVKKLKKRLLSLGCNEVYVNNVVDKNELIEEIMRRFPEKKRWKTKYDLIAQIVHDGKEYHTGNNKSLIYHKPNNMWYEMQDLHVQERMPQLVAISEAYIQTWVRKD